MVSRTISALRSSRSDCSRCAGRLSQRCRLSAHIEVCAAALGGGARCDAHAFRFTGERERTRCARRTWPLAIWLYTSLSRRERADGALSDERHAGCGGYPWTVICMEDRAPYLAALDSASIDFDIRPFAGFIGERVRWPM